MGIAKTYKTTALEAAWILAFRAVFLVLKLAFS